MHSSEKSEALNGMNRFVRTERIKTWSFLILAFAGIVWAVAMIVLVFSYDDLVNKNERLVVVVEDLETQNGKLNDRLQCRIDQNDEMSRSIGQGLVAVARGDDTALEAEAQHIIDLTNQEPCN
jgi:hypothetical protein